MTTINDQGTTERCSKIIQIARKLSELMAQGREHELFMALSDIEVNARDCLLHMNDLHSKAGKWHPFKEPMGS